MLISHDNQWFFGNLEEVCRKHFNVVTNEQIQAHNKSITEKILQNEQQEYDHAKRLSNYLQEIGKFQWPIKDPKKCFLLSLEQRSGRILHASRQNRRYRQRDRKKSEQVQRLERKSSPRPDAVQPAESPNAKNASRYNRSKRSPCAHCLERFWVEQRCKASGIYCWTYSTISGNT